MDSTVPHLITAGIIAANCKCLCTASCESWPRGHIFGQPPVQGRYAFTIVGPSPWSATS